MGSSLPAFGPDVRLERLDTSLSVLSLTSGACLGSQLYSGLPGMLKMFGMAHRDLCPNLCVHSHLCCVGQSVN